MAEATVLAVLLNFRTPEMTLRAAEAALAALEGLNAELVIVDNDSGDGSFERLSQDVSARGWPVRVMQSGANGGFGAGNNFGIRAGLTSGSTPDYYYILNSDAFPAKTAIRELFDFLQNHEDAGFAGSYIHGPDGAPHVTSFRFPTALSEFESALRFGPVSRILRNFVVPMPVPEASQAVDWLAGASVMMRAQVLEEVGLFDERFFLYFEETDLCLRASRAGWPTIYVRSSEVEHIGSVSTGMKAWERVPGYWFDSRWHYFSKNKNKAYALYATALHLIGGAFHRFRALLTGRDPNMPAHFLRDMARHALRSFFTRSRRKTTSAPSVEGSVS